MRCWRAVGIANDGSDGGRSIVRLFGGDFAAKRTADLGVGEGSASCGRLAGAGADGDDHLRDRCLVRRKDIAGDDCGEA